MTDHQNQSEETSVKPTSRWKKVCLRIAIYLAVFQVILSTGMYFFQYKLIYIPSREVQGVTPQSRGMDFEEVAFQGTDGTELWGWFVPAKPRRGTVLFCHGNAGNLTHRLGSIALFHDLGYDVFIFDYRGFGKSEGSPDEEGTYRDGEGAWKYLVDKRGIASEEIAVFGRSLGGGVGSYLAEKYRPGALILESTFTSLPDVAAEIYPFLPVRLLAAVEYPTLGRLAAVKCPLLVIHSPDDEVIPYHHGKKLYQEGREPKEFLKIHGGHNVGFVRCREMLFETIGSFLKRHLPSTEKSSENKEKK